MPPRSTSNPRESSPQRTVLAAVQSRTFAPAYYLHGDDDYLKDVAIQDLLNAALDPSTRDFNCDVRRAAELDAEAVNDVLGTPPMLAERRAVVIRDVSALKKAPRAQLEKYLQRPATDTLLILTSPAGAKTDSLIADATVALNFAPLSPERVRKWIAHHVATVLHVSITDEAIQHIQQAVGNDLQMLAGELDKCASYALGAHERATAAQISDAHQLLTNTQISGAQDIGPSKAGMPPSDEKANDSGTSAITIDADSVAAIVGVRRGETVADLLDAVARHDADAAIKLIPHILSQPKMSGVLLVIMLSTQAFALAYGRSRRDAGVTTNRLPSEFFAFLKETGGFPGRPYGEAASLWTKAVDGWSALNCERALQLLLNADIALKETVISDSEQTVTSLVLALCALRSRNRKVA